MNFLPVVQRELLVAARKGSGAWFRFSAVLLGTGFFLLLWSTPIRAQPQVVSDVVFRVLASALFGFALMSGGLFTADSLTSEKRAGTLGLLFLTELRGYDIILGKLVATSLRAVYAVIAMIPVLALPVLVGGVSGGQVFRTVTVILLTMGLSLSFGMMASVFARDFRSALLAALLGIGLLSVGLDGASWGWQRIFRRSALGVQSFSPTAAFRWAHSEPRTAPVRHQAFQMAVKKQGLVTVVLLAVASFLVRDYRDRVLETPPLRDGEGKPRKGALVGYRHIHWGLLLEQKPYAWFQRVMRPVPFEFTAVFYGLGFLLAVGLVASMAATTQAAAIWAVGACLALLWALHLLLKVQVAIASTRGIVEDRTSGALELLVAAGQGRDEILRGHHTALLQQYRVPALVLVGLQFLPLLRLSMNDLPVSAGIGVVLLLIYGVAVLTFDLETLAMVGFRHGLREADPQTAFRATFMQVMMPGWVGMLPLAMLAALGGGTSLLWLAFHLWLFATGYMVYRARKRARIDIEHGFLALAAGLDFDTDDYELRDDFRRAAGTQYPSGGLRTW